MKGILVVNYDKSEVSRAGSEPVYALCMADGKAAPKSHPEKPQVPRLRPQY